MLRGRVRDLISVAYVLKMAYIYCGMHIKRVRRKKYKRIALIFDNNSLLRKTSVAAACRVSRKDKDNNLYRQFCVLLLHI